MFNPFLNIYQQNPTCMHRASTDTMNTALNATANDDVIHVARRHHIPFHMDEWLSSVRRI